MGANFARSRRIGARARLAFALVLAVLGYGFELRTAEAGENSGPVKSQAAPPGWFRILKLGPGTYAISEPKYWQQNVSYLIVGNRSGILFDTGPGLYSIRLVTKELTALPLLVIPSHLHFDHVGRIQEFSNIGLPDIPMLRQQVHAHVLAENPPQYMLTTPHAFKVSRWLRDGEQLDLGARQLTVLSTPGHTPDSVTLVDREHRLLFTGDLVNRLVTLCDVPGSDIRETARSLERIVNTVPPGSSAFEGHAEIPISWNELTMLAHGAQQISDGRLPSEPMCLGGLPMRQFAVGTFMFVLPSSPDIRLQPLTSVTQTLDWRGSACSGPRE
jgi:glyoxylase-like metal-dependent hydrolase (beta-lactamase superfamily II)